MKTQSRLLDLYVQRFTPCKITGFQIGTLLPYCTATYSTPLFVTLHTAPPPPLSEKTWLRPCNMIQVRHKITKYNIVLIILTALIRVDNFDCFNSTFFVESPKRRL